MPSHHGVKFEPDEVDYPNETIKLLLERGSCRNFTERKIEPEVLDYILRAGVHSATGGNLQPYSIIKIEDEDMRKKMAEKNGNQKFMAKAPVHLLFCLDWHRLKRWAELEVAPFTATSSFKHFWVSFQDVIISAQSICTAAASFGIGSIYIGTILGFMDEIRDIFALPKGVFPVVMLCLGYPELKPSPRRKLPPSVIVHNEKYRDPENEELLRAFNEKYPGHKTPVTEENLEHLACVCRKVHGEEFAKKCIEAAKKNGYINQVQIYFGLHYDADGMAEGNDEHIKSMEKAGFKCFKKFEPEI